MNFKKYIKTRGCGFWATAATSALAALTVIVYSACYAATQDFSTVACVLTAVCACAAGLLFTKFGTVAPYLQLVIVLAAFGFYVYSIYYYVSIVMVGIDLDSFSAEFIVCTVLYLVLIIGAVVSLFLKQGKKEVEGENA